MSEPSNIVSIMAEGKKGVTVLAVTAHGHGEESHYPAGQIIKVHNEGHLYVYDDGGYTLAIYAPGKWLKAEAVN